MGLWADYEFGVTTLPPRAYLFAGTGSRAKIDAVISSFGEVLLHRHDVYERYLVQGERGTACVLFQLYGAPVVCDVLTVLKDGDVREAVFIGTACGLPADMNVGDFVVPTQVQTLDGTTAMLGAGPYTTPSAEMTDMIAAALARRQMPYRRGKSVSVPATFWHGDERKIDHDAIALELEFAAFCHCTQAAGIKAGGVLVISDTREKGLLDETRPLSDPRMVAAFQAIKEYWEQ